MTKRFTATEYKERAKEIVKQLTEGGYCYYDSKKKEAFYVPRRRPAPSPGARKQTSLPLSANRDNRAPSLLQRLRLCLQILLGRNLD